MKKPEYVKLLRALVNTLLPFLEQEDPKKTSCSHMAGGGTYHRTSIVWHLFEDDAPGQPKGICTNCQRRFLPTDPDYKSWLAKSSNNSLSTGLRFEDSTLAYKDELKAISRPELFPADSWYDPPTRQSLKSFLTEELRPKDEGVRENTERQYVPYRQRADDLGTPRKDGRLRPTAH